jgi:hypothetical protein
VIGADGGAGGRRLIRTPQRGGAAASLLHLRWERSNMTTTTRQLELWPGMPADRCPLCRSTRPAPATCAKCALRVECLARLQASWAEERAALVRESLRLATERDERERQAQARLDRLAALGRPVRVALVGCGKGKRPGRHPARQLYTGSLFRAALAHAEKTADEVVILSALHAVVAPDEPLDAYDVRLEQYRKREREWWASRVVTALAGRYAGLPVELTIYAGKTYAAAVEHGLIWQSGRRLRVVQVRQPLRGLGLGERLGWFKRARQAERPTPANICQKCRRVLLQDWERAAGGVCSLCIDREARRRERAAERADKRAAERRRERSPVAAPAPAPVEPERPERCEGCRRPGPVVHCREGKRTAFLCGSPKCRALLTRRRTYARIIENCRLAIVERAAAAVSALETRPRGGYTATAAPSTEAP